MCLGFCTCQHGEAIEAALCSVILHTEESLQWKKEHCFNSLKTALANVPQVRLISGMVSCTASWNKYRFCGLLRQEVVHSMTDTTGSGVSSTGKLGHRAEVLHHTDLQCSERQ